MTIDLVKPAGWSLGEKLTSDQVDALDANTTFAADKRAGETDTIECVWTFTGAGRVIPSYEAGADSNQTYTLSSGISWINASTGLSAAREYTLSNSGAVQGDTVHVTAGSQDVTVKNAAGTTLIVIGSSSSGANSSTWAEFRFNGSAWILTASAQSSPQQRQVFTGNGTYTVPPGIYKLLVIGCGGGGGGGGGGGAYFPGASFGIGGGGGGGAAPYGIVSIDTTPASAIAVNLGSGGAGGNGGAGAQANGANGNDGSDGTSTTFGSLATFYGGQGGTGGGTSVTPTTQYNTYAPGGGTSATGTKADRYSGAAAGNRSPLGVRWPGEGGYGGGGGTSATGSRNGAAGNYPSASSTTAGSGSTAPGAGGTAGVVGSESSTPGGGGGGGGASVFGNGGAGGAGGNAADSIAMPGSNGTAGGVGAGGGGGGGAGGNDTAGGSYGSGGNGAAGGAGVLIVIPIR